MNNILIVDDQQGIRLLLDEVFKREGLSTFLAASGIEALEIVRKVKLDVILLDLKLPSMDGIEILKRIKITLPNVPVVMMSAYGEVGLIQETMELGASHYMTKPFDIYELRDVVRGILASLAGTTYKPQVNIASDVGSIQLYYTIRKAAFTWQLNQSYFSHYFIISLFTIALDKEPEAYTYFRFSINYDLSEKDSKVTFEILHALEDKRKGIYQKVNYQEVILSLLGDYPPVSMETFGDALLHVNIDVNPNLSK